MSDDDGIARAVARKLVALNKWMKTEPLKAPLEQKFPTLKAAGDKFLQAQYDSHAEQRRRENQDLELQAAKDKLEAVKRSQMAPTDLGDVDAPAEQPGIRQPIQMEREFGNDEARKAAYIENVRKAMENAKK